jgi:phosphoribosylglycinamide formyltransferase 1
MNFVRYKKSLSHTVTHQLAIFASGNGSNAEAIIKYFEHDNNIKIALVVSNNPAAGVNEIAKRNNIPLQIISNLALQNPELILEQMKIFEIDWIVLAGFLRKMPVNVIKKFRNKIINIHPALLPKYGGKGMYGNKVHEAVILNKETEAGITIHFVNEHYDEGEIIFQKKISVAQNETVETLRIKINRIEHQHYPAVIQQVINNLPVTG